MTTEELEPNYSQDHMTEFLDGSGFMSFFDVSYNPDDFIGDSWWIQSQSLEQDLVTNSTNSFNSNSSSTTSACETPNDSVLSTNPPASDSSRKRKGCEDSGSTPKSLQSAKKNQGRRMTEANTDLSVEQRVPARRSAGNKKTTARSAGNNCNNGNNKEGRWAEQLLNPCAAAMILENPSRVQHLMLVLNELASPAGDANHRLAHHGLLALKHYLSSPGFFSAPLGVNTFAHANPKFFKDALINFNEINPWFRIPNSIANSSILQILTENDQPRNLHILDIGVSHGVQWPILLEELTRRTGGPPPLVRLTVIAPDGDNEQSRSTPFAAGPTNYNFTSQLLAFAKAININLQIKKINHPLTGLNCQVIDSSPDETLIVCAQFRLHNLNHNIPDERTEFLRMLRSLEPKGVILSENNTDCSCANCGDFATGFSRRVDYLWRFLDSTSAAYKGRETEERRMMEAEAAKALTSSGEMNERKEKWCDRMRSAGFAGVAFGEETTDGARLLLKKFDSNWETRVEEKDGCLGLWWKGHPVSFCSLWKTDTKTS